MLFDWLVTGHILAANPASSVRGPRYSVSRGAAPVLSSDQADVRPGSPAAPGWEARQDNEYKRVGPPIFSAP